MGTTTPRVGTTTLAGVQGGRRRDLGSLPKVNPPILGREGRLPAGADPMPVVLRYKGFRFFFYSNEGTPREPVHVHVLGAEGEAKLWLRPAVSVAESVGYNAATLRELVQVVNENRALIERTWHAHFT